MSTDVTKTNEDSKDLTTNFSSEFLATFQNIDEEEAVRLVYPEIRILSDMKMVMDGKFEDAKDIAVGEVGKLFVKSDVANTKKDLRPSITIIPLRRKKGFKITDLSKPNDKNLVGFFDVASFNPATEDCKAVTAVLGVDIETGQIVKLLIQGGGWGNYFDVNKPIDVIRANVSKVHKIAKKNVPISCTKWIITSEYKKGQEFSFWSFKFDVIENKQNIVQGQSKTIEELTREAQDLQLFPTRVMKEEVVFETESSDDEADLMGVDFSSLDSDIKTPF